MNIVELHKENLAGVPASQLAARHGITRASMCGLLFRHRSQLKKDARDLIICRLLDEGVSVIDLCDKYGVTPAHIASLKRGMLS